MTDQLLKLPAGTLMDTPNAISSPELADGPMHSPLPISLQIDMFGLDHAHANHSVQPANKKVKAIIVTSGQNGSASSASAALQSSLVNRLQARLPMDGWMRSRMIWKDKVTPSGRPYCQLAVSARRTVGTDYGLWPTPLLGGTGESMHGQISGQYREAMRQATPQIWPTPRASDGAKGGLTSGLDTLPGQAASQALWPTPRADKHNPQSREDFTPNLAAQVFGTESNGLQVLTENRGQLCPEFVCWLMGFPNEWLVCMVSAMQSYRRSRRSSSKLTKASES